MGERAWRHDLGSDEGGAIVEFLGVTLLLLVPLAYLVVALSGIQAGTYAVEVSAREAARGAVVAGVRALDDGRTLPQAMRAAEARARAVAELAMEDFGFGDRASYDLRLTCSSTPCLRPGSLVRADVELTVRLPGMPASIGGRIPLAASVSSSATSPVDGFASAP